MRDRKIYVADGDASYCSWLENVKIVNSIEQADTIMLTGGSDVDPSIYGKKSHPTIMSNLDRDKYEMEVFNKAVKMNKKIIGICRGAQLICALSGGLLCQHMRHPYLHKIQTNDGRKYIANSAHHNIQWPFNLPDDDYELIAWAINDKGEPKLSPFMYGESYEDDISGNKEVEIAYYRKYRAVALQPHPEWLANHEEQWAKDFVNYCRELVSKYLDI